MDWENMVTIPKHEQIYVHLGIHSILVAIGHIET